MRRVTEVIDCWYDSGAMPFAQWGYPPPGPRAKFDAQFPADFISEAIDQTRGWFYSQLAISTLLFGERRRSETAEATGNAEVAAPDSPPSPDSTAHSYPHPFRNCIVLGLMLGEDGQKMSKSKRNYREPNEIFDRYGADALRWYFFANQPPWTSIRYSEQAIKDSIPEFLLRLWNVYSFFVIYANIDGFDPARSSLDGRRSASSTPAVLAPRQRLSAAGGAQRARPLDAQRTATARPRRSSSGWTPTTTSPPASRSPSSSTRLSNWYVRRSRDRFWSRRQAVARQARRLLDALRVPADDGQADRPVRAVSGRGDVAEPGSRACSASRALESVHLCDYPDRRSGGDRRSAVRADEPGPRDRLRSAAAPG